MNLLADAQSAYLRSAAHQPVHWMTWGEDAFARATRENRPILLDIGAAWCHWCHVMDGESYEDPEVASYLNEHFVCVKVDRDERPDVDTRYQRAVQGLTGQGGWPLTAFLTAAGDVFFGGTYFPPEGRFGRPGFLSVLRRVADIYKSEPDRVAEQASELKAFVVAQLDEAAPGPVDRGTLDRAVTRMIGMADRRFGGFGRSPKFPHPAAIQLLLHRAATGDPNPVRAIATEALNGMAAGGIRDQLAGGFHRYSTDERWVIPHFEKMSYDNSELLRVYAEATAAFGEPRYAAVTRETAAWVLEVLGDPAGGYAASQDADQGPDDDGDYFTWSMSEIDQTLSSDEAKIAIARFGIGTHGRMPHDSARNVLFLADSIAEVAGRIGKSEAEAVAVLDQAVAKLRRARAARPAPFIDRTRYTAWNAMMASAMLRAGAVLGDPAITDHAILSLGRLRSEQPAPDQVLHTIGGVPGLLEDRIAAAAAGLDAYESTGDRTWLDWSAGLMDRAIADCWDEAGGFFDLPNDARAAGLLAARAKPIQDAPTPSANGTAGVTLARLHALTGEERWRTRLRALIAAFGSRAEELGPFGATYLLALDWSVSPISHIVITGPEDSRVARELHADALAAFVPRRVIHRVLPGSTVDLSAEPALAAMVRDPARVAGYVCVGTRCLAPASDRDAWRTSLADALLSLNASSSQDAS